MSRRAAETPREAEATEVLPDDALDDLERQVARARHRDLPFAQTRRLRSQPRASGDLARRDDKRRARRQVQRWRRPQWRDRPRALDPIGAAVLDLSRYVND
jgi:hypothetical protein